MNISASQAQLLRQLNIKPLQRRDCFFAGSPDQTATLAADTATLLQPEDGLLSRDIRQLLAQTSISDWLLNPAASQSVLTENGSVLVTPILNTLQHPAAKQQLWALLQQQLVNDAD
ncbi:hypothetical protein [Arsukibacterium sp.]|uniref:hypothetical protein n=1 Tax=Arsukibacterium sp. TaxID=1977258 RepID=UPI00299D259E|nr:hypothetical protein [Arsukibacterium sp.]MDX1536679.1 hypothetical protein [Arsukibacterium sp.]